MPDYNLAIANNPKYATAYYLRGNFKTVKLKDYRGAIADYTQTIMLKPKHSGAYINRSDSKFKLNDFQGALSDADKAIEIESNKIYYAFRAIVKFQLNDKKGAEIDLTNVIPSNHSNAEDYFNSAAVNLAFFQRPVKALEDLKKARELLAQSHIKSGTLLQAIAHLSGQVKYAAKDIPGALSEYNLVIELDPNDTQAYLFRALLKANELKDFQGARLDFDQSIKLDPNNAQAYLFRASLKTNELKDFQGARLDFDQSIKLDPNNAQAYLSRALFKAEKLKDFQGARLDFDQSIQLDHKNLLAYLSRGALRLTFNNRVGAIEDVRKAAQLYKTNPTYLGIESEKVLPVLNSLLKILEINDIKL